MNWYEKYKVGQKVKVVKKVESWGYPDYWYGATWARAMNETIGNVYKIVGIDKKIGIRLLTKSESLSSLKYNYWYPVESLADVKVKGEQLYFDYND